jgi:RIO kinase 1
MMISSERKRELKDLLKYMAPGTTIEDLMEDDSSDDDGYAFETVATKGGSGVKVVSTANGGSNKQQHQTSMSKMQPQQHNINNTVLSKIRVDDYYEGGMGGGGGSGGSKMNQKVLNELREATMSSKYHKTNEIDRSERATTENVMDPRTRMILYKLVNSGMLREVNGCVSTGKEANVYYAVRGDGSDAALKVYKTSILVFKDREQYVTGEFRFQRYCKSNPRKMVRTWAEKEARNLGRLANAGIRAPKVVILRQHVLVMEFIGVDGWPAPRLKEVKFPSTASMDRCYLELCVTVRIMFQSCKLVHGDLSEYNLLFHEGHLVVIDVSQSVEHEHPQAIAFLRRDIVNVNAFFRGRGHQHLFTLQDLYTFITVVDDGDLLKAQSTREQLTEYLVALREEREQAGVYGPVDIEQAKIDEQVFLRIEVPRSLECISDMKAPNAEVRGFVEGLLAVPEAQKPSEPTAATKKKVEGVESGSDEEDDDEEGEEGEEDEEGEERAPRAHGAKTLNDMTKEERKEHKKAVKEANREKRQAKMPKHEKKKATRRVKHK